MQNGMLMPLLLTLTMFVSIKQKLIFRSFQNWSEKAINIKILWAFSRI